MNHQSKEELIIELQQLQLEHNSLKLAYEKETADFKFAKDQLQVQMNNLYAVFESSPIAMFVIDESTNIVMTNLAFVVLCGGSEADILQHRPGEALRCIHSHTDPRGCGYAPTCKYCNVRNGVEGLIAHGGSLHGAELEVELARNGESGKYWMNIGVEPLMMDGKNYWCVAMDEVTSRKKGEELFRENETKYRTLFETANDAILLFADGTWDDCNEGALKVFGCTREEIIGAHPKKFSPPTQPDGSSSEEEAFKKISLAFSGTPQFFEWEHCKADATTFAAEVSLNRLDLKGKPYIMAIVRDVSARKKAEEANNQNSQLTNALLQLNQMRNATLQEITDFTLEEAVRITQSKIGYLAFLNEDESILNMHSWSKSAMAECAIADKPFMYPVVNTGLWGEAVRQRKAIVTNDYQASNPLVKGIPQGHVKLKRHMNAPVFDGSKMVIVAGVGNKNEEYNDKDVQFLTLLMEGMWRMMERQKAEQELRTLNAELEQRVADRTSELAAANKELEAFSYSVSHDLRAPLRHISGYVELLQAKFHDLLPEKGKHYLDSISGSSHEMGTLIDNLLQFSRTGRAEMHKSEIDMNEIVNTVIKSISAENLERSINWNVDKLPIVRCDSNLLKQVWVNLLSNAIKYSKTRDKAQIDIGVSEEKNEFIFYVRDNGVGFEMQYSHKLFGVFQRLHPTGEFEGTGIGLANVRQIISRHGGRTWAEAELDKGATFYFSLTK